MRPQARSNNPLKGLGHGLITIASGEIQQVVLRERKARDEAESATVVTG
jgi:hypothetical protein